MQTRLSLWTDMVLSSNAVGGFVAGLVTGLALSPILF